MTLSDHQRETLSRLAVGETAVLVDEVEVSEGFSVKRMTPFGLHTECPEGDIEFIDPPHGKVGDDRAPWWNDEDSPLMMHTFRIESVEVKEAHPEHHRYKGGPAKPHWFTTFRRTA